MTENEIVMKTNNYLCKNINFFTLCFRVFNINNNQLENKHIVVNPKEKKESLDLDSDVDSDDL